MDKPAALTDIPPLAAAFIALLLAALLAEIWRRHIRRMREQMAHGTQTPRLAKAALWGLRHGDFNIKLAHAGLALGLWSAGGTLLLRFLWPETPVGSDPMRAISDWSIPFLLLTSAIVLSMGRAGPKFVYRPEDPATWPNGTVSLFCWFMALIYPAALATLLVLAVQASAAPTGLLILLRLLPVAGSIITGILATWYLGVPIIF